MKIIISVETHTYEEDHLVDDKILNELLGDDIDSCGVIDPEIILPIRRNRNPKFLFEYTQTTTIKQVVDAIFNIFGFPNLEDMFLPDVAFWCENIRYWIDNKDANFQNIVEKHLDPKKVGIIFAALYISGDAGSIWVDDGVRYYMNSRERGKHNEPHVHLLDLNSHQEAVIIIRTLEIIGKFPPKLIKKVKKKVKSEERFLLEQWNTLTDGLRVDIDRYFGNINY